MKKAKDMKGKSFYFFPVLFNIYLKAKIEGAYDTCLSLMCPPEIREGFVELWPHVDQGILRSPDNTTHNNNPPEGFVSESRLKSKPFTVQGQFLFEDSFEGDGGFYCIPINATRRIPVGLLI